MTRRSVVQRLEAAKAEAQAIALADIFIAGQLVVPRSVCNGFWVAPGNQRIYSRETAEKLAAKIFSVRGPRLRRAKA